MNKSLSANIQMIMESPLTIPIVVLPNETATLRARIARLSNAQAQLTPVAQAQLAPGINRPLQVARANSCAQRSAKRNSELGDKFVVLGRPADLKELKCCVNFYFGNAKHHSGWVTIFREETILWSAFAFDATRGNRRVLCASKTGDGWTTIPVAEIVVGTP